MFEISVALKYLTPRWRQLSVSIISLISILVIALVVWLVVVFFSVTHGLEKSWVQKLIALTAPIRITPTDAYFRSYYYQIDSLSAASNYSSKSIREKLTATHSDPYDPDYDGELPPNIELRDQMLNGALKDPVKEAFSIISSLPQIQRLTARDFEMTIGNLRMQLARKQHLETTQSFVSQTAYLGSFDPDNKAILDSIMPITAEDRQNILLQQASEANFVDSQVTTLPSNIDLGDGILLPKSFRASGILIGDRGDLSYFSPSMSSVQEQNLPVYVAGFYDPGIIPIGGKFILANPEVVSVIRSSQAIDENGQSNGINVRFDDINQAESIRNDLLKAFEEAGIARYWKIETYREFEFTKDLIQQLRSERNLWTLLATVIIIVACSNIISMLIILVNDKKLEIGILRAMGATSTSIAIIFGFCGMIMGTMGSVIGVTAAYFTLKNLQTIVDFIGRVQGYEMFNPVFYGNTLPNAISSEALLFVITTTAVISLLAGIVPAIKASLIKPAAILKAE